MTNSLPTGCIKDDSDINWQTFNNLLEKVNFEDEIRHLFVVDIIFDLKNASKKQLAYNEIYPPIIEKRKLIDPCEKYFFLEFRKMLYSSEFQKMNFEKKGVFQ